jgi:hypothetical protein
MKNKRTVVDRYEKLKDIGTDYIHLKLQKLGENA